MTEAPARPRLLPAGGGPGTPLPRRPAEGPDDVPPASPDRVALPDLGAEVARLRRERRLSPADLSRATRIRPALLAALERGDLEELGAPVYVRGHLRAVATALGADGEAWVRRYAEAAGDRTPPVLLPRQAREQRERRPVPGAVKAVAGAAALLAALALVGVVGRPGGGVDVLEVAAPARQDGSPAPPAQDAGGERSAEEPAEDGAGSAPAPPGPQDAPGAPTATGTDAPRGPARPTDRARQAGPAGRVDAGRAAVVVRAEGRTWVQATDASGDVVLEGILEAGTTRELTAPRRLDLVVGAPAVVTLAVDGGRPRAAGPDGTVARWTVTPGGLAPTRGTGSP